MTDDQAILGCQSGDRNSFRHLVDRYKDVLYGTAFLMTRDRSLTEEHVQETLLSAWKGISGFNRDRPFKPWLVRILVNIVLSHQRKRSVVTVPLGPLDHLDSSASPTESLETSEDHNMVRRALGCLSTEHREVVVLRYFAELTVPQIARTMRVREGTVKSRLHRALGHLRQDLQEFIHREV